MRLLKRRSRRPAVSSYDIRALRRGRLRAGALRVVLAGGAVALLGAAAASARGLDVRERSFLPPGSTGVVVVDVSLSIAEANYVDVRRTLRQLVRIDAPVGLVVFSDVPYELLPPGTPASELEPLLRVLQPSKSAAAPPINPWWDTYRAGTRISEALAMARDMLERDKIDDGFIVLVSDLETAPDDVQATTRVIEDIRRESIDMRIVPMSASGDSLRLFQGLLGPKAFAPLPRSEGEERQFENALDSGVPTRLLLLGGLLFALLALHEQFSGRLALPRGKRSEV
jgi:von Willebrand factor type A domain